MSSILSQTSPQDGPAPGRNANVLFVNLPSVPYTEVTNYLAGSSSASTQLHGEPLGILYVASHLKKFGNFGVVAVLDYALNLARAAEFVTCDDFIVKLARTELDFVPDIIGFSINFTCSHMFLMKAAELLKRLYPRSLVVVGGFHATNATADLLQSTSIDYVFRGEGELSFTRFVECFNQGTLATADIQGVYCRRSLPSSDGAAGASALKNGTPAEDLDLLPFPDRTIINMERYALEQGRATILSKAFQKRKASIITNRGCYFSCSFCASRTVFARKMRFRTTGNVLDEMRDLHRRHGVNFFVIEDDLFTGDQQKCLDFLRGIKTLGIDGMEIQFPNDLNINTTNEAIFDAMVDAGLKVAHLAVESGSPYVQSKIITKYVKLDRVKPHVQYLQKKGVVVKCIYILGFPGETLEMMQATIDFARGVGADWSLFNIATPLLGTPMCDQFVRLGYVKRDVQALGEIDFKYRSFDTTEISAKDLNTLQYRANLDINFVNNRHYLNGNYTLAIGTFEEIIRKYPFHIVALACLRRCYEKLADAAGRDATTEAIRLTLQSDIKAWRMLADYGDMMPELAEFYPLLQRPVAPRGGQLTASGDCGGQKPAETPIWAEDPRSKQPQPILRLQDPLQ